MQLNALVSNMSGLRADALREAGTGTQTGVRKLRR